MTSNTPTQPERTTPDFRDYVLEQLSLLSDLTCRPMMGEYLLYSDGVLFGGLYNNRLLIKITLDNAKYCLSEAIPYPGAKPMYQIENLDQPAELRDIILTTCQSLPRKHK